ncbi:flagellar assembly peptidoglycan hydrolase FlgJ [Vibrio sp. LQ2]|uniref:flagellar assembly peptidoglycan hydrolase FlgJ n=1 Tax=Vibrio sp. LQ2 TaxID=2883075 RepID=UPI00208FBF30|nr:flagellar assembly peptidoglycan hydrolase FlgJ [Vibrio sp. LQ2]ELL7087289.1 flagellar assembly peptidoglycan hydrolase FlgJ [Vibrio fluvialis]ELV8761993.1 flagellar assembly peptidoglycan hydrolase FlgJ [Vibrio fluvialis]ELV8853468.1 flagellar assembly peptidoglycan hydrolase FlgJ [Vibrio fluvialis]USP05437.1 flagellar assembly peptidoglycan hydrolase FlgJ [Vibrio sp. LQ2]
MVNNPNDIGFIHDIASLDTLRKQAVTGDEKSEKEALTAAARQFEAIFTTMMLKSMRDANSSFKSDMFNSQNEDFYRQMLDEQMTSQLSASGSLGLADMIVAQLSTAEKSNTAGEDNFQEAMRRVEHSRDLAANQPASDPATEAASVTAGEENTPAATGSFDSPQSFVASLKPFADKAAKALGVDSTLLLAQAALETGWGQKVVKNARGSSNNLFNIKADRSWHGAKVATQTLEYQGQTPVMEKAAFRSYSNYQDSFNDYVRFLANNPRYTTALRHGGSDEDFIRGIHQAGYATDPQYADKVLRVKAQIEQMDEL